MEGKRNQVGLEDGAFRAAALVSALREALEAAPALVIEVRADDTGGGLGERLCEPTRCTGELMSALELHRGPVRLVGFEGDKGAGGYVSVSSGGRGDCRSLTGYTVTIRGEQPAWVRTVRGRIDPEAPAYMRPGANERSVDRVEVGSDTVSTGDRRGFEPNGRAIGDRVAAGVIAGGQRLVGGLRQDGVAKCAEKHR